MFNAKPEKSNYDRRLIREEGETDLVSNAINSY
jgi:hypothetical protein